MYIVYAYVCIIYMYIHVCFSNTTKYSLLCLLYTNTNINNTPHNIVIQEQITTHSTAHAHAHAAAVSAHVTPSSVLARPKQTVDQQEGK